jgi:DNA-binding transcriptional LysR family regulator
LRILELRPNELIERIREGVVDFGITSQDVPQEGEFECIKRCERESRIAVRRGHPGAHLQSLDAIRQLPWITLDPSGDTNTPFRELFEQCGLALPQQITECSSMLLAMHLALLSESALLLSEESFKTDSIKSEFVELDYRGQIPLRPIFLLHRPEFAMSAAARRLFRLVQTHFVS